MRRVRQSLTARLILAFALVSVLGIGLAALLAHAVTVREFERFFVDKNRSEFVAAAVAYYQAHDSWAGVNDRPAPRAVPPGGKGRPAPPSFALVDDQGIVVSNAAPYRLGERVPAAMLDEGQAVMVDGRRIGTVLDAARRPTLSDREAQYLASTDRALALAALGAVTLALLTGVVLARGLTQPLRELTRAVRAMTGGDLRQQLPIRSADELGELVAAFNQLSAELARSNEVRRQMTADIAHDLGTPLTVITGYIEGLRDGALQPTSQRFETMHTEAQHLKHLVEDLRTLSLADAGELPLQRRPVAPTALLARVMSAHQPQATRCGVELTTQAPPGLADIDVDEERMVQVLGNLVGNALRHTPPQGHVEVRAEPRAGQILFTVRDDGEGIHPEDLPRVFDRFYRADAARAASGAESGLGLAISKAIVEAHGGSIAITSAPGNGTIVTVALKAGPTLAGDASGTGPGVHPFESKA